MTPIEATLACPVCGSEQTAVVPDDACQYFFDCRACQAVIRPKPGDCCVFCSYSNVRCPSSSVEAAPPRLG